jgi:hypothetical protein
MTTPTPSPWPEHDKQSAVKDTSQAIGEFVDWLATQGIYLLRFNSPTAASSCDHTHPVELRRLLAEFFDIDLDVINAEKEAMIDTLRAMNRPQQGDAP